jgi:crossover junction endodeoxyribonuclease RuvC
MNIILGIDPGLSETGWGIIASDGQRYIHKDHGVIKTASSLELGERLVSIHDALYEIIQQFKPNYAGIESLFFAKNVLSAIPVAHARGIMMYTLSKYALSIKELPPQEIKRSIVGNGRADKFQVQHMVKILLGLPDVPKPDHAADALAAAICRANSVHLEDM